MLLRGGSALGMNRRTFLMILLVRRLSLARGVSVHRASLASVAGALCAVASHSDLPHPAALAGGPPSFYSLRV